MSGKSGSIKRHQPKGVTILHDDRDILVVEKAAGLLTMGTDREKARTVYYKLTDFVRKGNAKSRKHVFIVHRLDRDASGILVFAKSRQAKSSLQEQWEAAEKKYLAIVHGRLAEKRGTISSYLAENNAHVVYATKNTRKGKLSHTAYEVVKETKDFSLLEVTLLTGRKHQIRVHLANLGHPIVGDKKYGKGDKAHRRLALHAQSLCFKHPYSGERVTFESKTPGYFHRLLGAGGEAAAKTPDPAPVGHEAGPPAQPPARKKRMRRGRPGSRRPRG